MRALDDNGLCERPFAGGETTAVSDVDVFVAGSGLRESPSCVRLGGLSPPRCRAAVAWRHWYIVHARDDEGTRALAETIAHVVEQVSEFAT